MKKLGFGCMRLPSLNGVENTVDLDQFKEMVDLYMASGCSYFDTARVYLAGQSEIALREGLVKRYPRDSFTLTDKLSGSLYNCEADIRPLFQKQLEDCGVEYFDYYLMHSMTVDTYEKAERCNAFAVVRELKEEGKVRHMGISFHDKPAVLERILTEHPEIEIVQIQLNYLDYDSATVESGAVYEVCRKFNKPVLVMEPVKGGVLANLGERESKVLMDLNNGSVASYAIRYAASFEGVYVVLSGMSDLAQMKDNLSYMTDFQPLTDAEREAIGQVCTILKSQDMIACTACRYCTPGCPKNIPIPDLFASVNAVRRQDDWSNRFYYEVSTEGKGIASDCIGCKQCERICPQHLPITEYLEVAREMFETGTGE